MHAVPGESDLSLRIFACVEGLGEAIRPAPNGRGFSEFPVV